MSTIAAIRLVLNMLNDELMYRMKHEIDEYFELGPVDEPLILLRVLCRISALLGSDKQTKIKEMNDIEKEESPQYMLKSHIVQYVGNVLYLHHHQSSVDNRLILAKYLTDTDLSKNSKQDDDANSQELQETLSTLAETVRRQATGDVLKITGMQLLMQYSTTVVDEWNPCKRCHLFL